MLTRSAINSYTTKGFDAFAVQTGRQSRVNEILQVSIPQHAFASPFLMQCVLGLSALHPAAPEPGRLRGARHHVPGEGLRGLPARRRGGPAGDVPGPAGLLAAPVRPVLPGVPRGHEAALHNRLDGGVAGHRPHRVPHQAADALRVRHGHPLLPPAHRPQRRRPGHPQQPALQ